ncbi:PIN domain-containing protein [Candidatus Micrarchaeota archaeon]|nr:PIN domain-containing protein [Candidatus Micrarchaeota archaeon]
MADTSILIDYLQNRTSPQTDARLESGDGGISIVTYFEALRHLHKKVSGMDFEILRQRLLQFDMLPLVSDACEMAARVSHSKGLSTTGALIYATAQTNGLELLTSDSDFSGLSGVKFLRPKQ